jgi:hypothetical protein
VGFNVNYVYRSISYFTQRTWALHSEDQLIRFGEINAAYSRSLNKLTHAFSVKYKNFYFLIRWCINHLKIYRVRLRGLVRGSNTIEH